MLCDVENRTSSERQQDGHGGDAGRTRFSKKISFKTNELFSLISVLSFKTL